MSARHFWSFQEGDLISTISPLLLHPLERPENPFQMAPQSSQEGCQGREGKGSSRRMKQPHFATPTELKVPTDIN